MLLWGIDLGGTKIEGVVLESREHPVVLKRMRVPTEAHLGYEHILNQIIKLVEVLIAEIGIRPYQIGIGTPGTLDPMTGLMKNCNSTVLNEKKLPQDLERILQIPIKIANDANCFAIAEATIGIVPEVFPSASVVFGVIMGTGVGGGLVVDGKLLSGRQGIAGEWGHNFLDDSGGACYCGKVGCVERVISGPALEQYYQKISGEPLRLTTIVERHSTRQDIHATQTIERLIDSFGKAISTVINIVDPDVVVLGGGLSKINLLYTDGVKAVEKYVFNPRLNTKFLAPKLGDSAGVFGAALL
ncbi:MAG: ROK family protein [Saprospiraceae bacterium]